jgi:phosphoglycolate phosphatase (TIGR01487 family)
MRPRPLALDIDGTMTDGDSVVDFRLGAALRAWPAPVVVATGKALPYPVALCEFLGLPLRVIAENGGVSIDETGLTYHGHRAAADRVADAYRAAGHDLGWGEPDMVNYWRETEVAVNRDRPLEPLRELAEREELRVLDTGFAYHVVAPDVDKRAALAGIAAHLGVDLDDFAAVGDSENDAAMLAAVGRSFAVANADEAAREAADTVLSERYGDGVREALAALREETDA